MRRYGGHDKGKWGKIWQSRGGGHEAEGERHQPFFVPAEQPAPAAS